MNNDQQIIDATLAHLLVANQFPQWKDLPVKAVIPGGWDNKTFRLGDHMLVRMPSSADYVINIKKNFIIFLF